MQRNLVKWICHKMRAISVCCREWWRGPKKSMIEIHNGMIWFYLITSSHMNHYQCFDAFWISTCLCCCCCRRRCCSAFLLLLLCQFCYRIMYNRWINDATVDVVINHWLIIFASKMFLEHITFGARVCLCVCAWFFIFHSLVGSHFIYVLMCAISVSNDLRVHLIYEMACRLVFTAIVFYGQCRLR